jgi:hypothetical protein
MKLKLGNHNPAIRDVAVEILRPLVTEIATKRAFPIDRIAEAARVPRMVARGCLVALANDGLVRPLDKGGDRWGVAHDFVARLLQPIVRNWRKSAWASARPWLAPAALLVWTSGALPTVRPTYSSSSMRAIGASTVTSTVCMPACAMYCPMRALSPLPVQHSTLIKSHTF